MTDFPASIPRPPVDSGPPGFVAAMNALADGVLHLKERTGERFDPTLSVYVPSGYDGATWRNRVEAAAHGRSTTVALVGSSSIAGVGATPDVTSGWAHLMRGLAQSAGYPIEGTGMCFVTPGVAATDNRWTHSSGIDTSWSSTLHRDVPTGEWIEFDSDDVTGTDVRVWYLQDAAEAFEVVVDGGSAVPITPDGTNSVGVWTSGTLADTAHTVRVTGNGSGASSILAVEVYKPGAPGLTFTVGGLGGAASTAWSAAWLEHNSNLRNSLRRPAALAIVASNGNDFTLGISNATLKARFTSIVEGFRFYNCEPIILAMPIVSGQDAQGYAAHVAALYEVAESESAMLIDMHHRWGSWAHITDAGFSADGTHPSTRGHASYARAVWRALGVY